MRFRDILLTLLLLSGGVLLVVTLILGVALSLGWLLTLFLPFTWFEATVLIFLTTATAIYIVRTVAGSLINSAFDDEIEIDEIDWLIEPDRFQRGAHGSTWRAWATFMIANQLALEIGEVEALVPHMDTAQQSELAVRLAEIAVAALERMQRPTSQPLLTTGALNREMKRRDLKPYDPDLAQLTVRVVNAGLRNNTQLAEVVSGNLWGEACTVPGW